MFSRKIILLSLFATTVTTTQLHAASDYAQEVPADVAAEFAGGTILTGLPADFPSLLIPASLDLRMIGSLQRDEYSQQILLRSSVQRDTLNQGLLAALTAQGWVDVNTPSFLSVSGLASLRLCHDQHGEMSINGTTTTYGTRLQVTRVVIPSRYMPRPCSEQQALARANHARYTFFNGIVPVLEVPEGTVDTPTPSAIRGASSSFSSTRVDISREGNIQVPGTTAAELHEHFAAQMRAQGWQADSDASGEISASSVWTRTVTQPDAAASEQVLASLTVLRGTGDFYAVNLNVRTPPADGGARGIVGVTPF